MWLSNYFMCILQVVKTRRLITMSEEEVMGGGYHKLSAYEPTNCDNEGKIPPSEAPYQKAKEFISRCKERRCCNVGRDKSVQKWQLPQDKPKVLIRKASHSGTTLYYHDDLRGSKYFPH